MRFPIGNISPGFTGVTQLAKSLSVTPQSVRAWCREGLIPFTQTDSGGKPCYLFSQDNITFIAKWHADRSNALSASECAKMLDTTKAKFLDFIHKTKIIEFTEKSERHRLLVPREKFPSIKEAYHEFRSKFFNDGSTTKKQEV